MIFLAVICSSPAPAQVTPPPAPAGFTARGSGNAHYSLSRQFIIHDLPATARQFIPHDVLTDNISVRLDPTLLTVSCERIKKALLSELGATDHWKGKVFIDLHPARRVDEMIVIASARYGKDWIYHLELPDTVNRNRLITAVTEVLLLEIANRESDHSAELPSWLGEGISQQLIQNSSMELVVESAQRVRPGVNSTTEVYREGRRVDPLRSSHETLLNQPPLSLEELSWPRADQLDGPDAETYRSSAQFFVNELLHLPDGRACLSAVIKELPQHLNWQLTFLHAFRSQFGSQLELEKWWALQLMAFTGRDLTQTWPAAESWKKLEEAVRPVVQVRTSPDELPMRTPVTLQTIVMDWDFSRQTPFLRDRIQQLHLLRTRVSQDVVRLVDDYRATLESYLTRRDQSGITPLGRAMSNPRLSSIARQAVKELDALDLRRERSRQKPEILPVVAANDSVNY